MNGPATLFGMAWDHPRALSPLEAVSGQWAEDHHYMVDWEARPLKDFEDQPLEELASEYDLVLMDYPFVATAADSGMIEPVDHWVSRDYLDDQARSSVGPSFSSYTWAGKQWALAIDAAAQVSALRPDLDLTETPNTWSELAVLARNLKDAPARVAMPLNPNHSYCAFLSVALAAHGPSFWPRGKLFDSGAARASLEFLRELAADLHPLSRSADPIAISDRMAGSDEIVFVPLMFGYSSYARPGFRQHLLKFGDAPRGESGHIGSVLGGVGIAVSALGDHQDAAADLARTLVSADVQSGPYVQSGGQPGHAAAWDSDEANTLVGNFFRATRATMQQAFLRPRVAGHRRFQPMAGELVSRFIWERDLDAGSCIAGLNRLAGEQLGNWA